MSEKLSHINARGEANMVDVSGKDKSHRVAVAAGVVLMEETTLDLLTAGDAKKGDVLASARIAGIMAAKRTSDLIPLCHPLALAKVTVDFDSKRDPARLAVRATAKVNGQTGVEMEALCAVSVACLTIYDMLKAVDKGMRLTDIHLLSKTGGKSGDFKSGDFADWGAQED